MQPKKIMIMAGGTGGHVFPALAVAEILKKEGFEILWLGTKERMEADLVPKYGIPIAFIQIKAILGTGLMGRLSAPFRILKAVLQARKIIKAFKPDVVLGMGGYVSGPGGIAAKLCGVPIVLHEQNGVAGMTNRWLAKIASAVLQAFPTAFKNAEVVGNPVRAVLLDLPDPKTRFQAHHGALNVLIMGGSQGAQILNQIVPAFMNQYPNQFHVWHQTGKNNQDKVRSSYQHLTVSDKVTEFIDDMKSAYEWADIVICRSGALTVSEIEVVGIGALFVPFMHKDKQQYWNAKPLEGVGAALIIEQPDFNVSALAHCFASLDRARCLQMAEKAKTLAIYDSAQRVAHCIQSCVQSRSERTQKEAKKNDQ